MPGRKGSNSTICIFCYVFSINSLLNPRMMLEMIEGDFVTGQQLLMVDKCHATTLLHQMHGNRELRDGRECWQWEEEDLLGLKRNDSKLTAVFSVPKIVWKSRKGLKSTFVQARHKCPLATNRPNRLMLCYQVISLAHFRLVNANQKHFCDITNSSKMA